MVVTGFIGSLRLDRRLCVSHSYVALLAFTAVYGFVEGLWEIGLQMLLSPGVQSL